MKERYDVTGMSCAACSARVEKAVAAVPGVTACSVSLLTNTMQVEGTADAAAVVEAVQKAGYGAKKTGEKREKSDPFADKESPLLLRRLLVSLVFLLFLMYLSMGHSMWGWPLPAAFDDPLFAGLCELLLAAAVLVVNQRFFVSGAKAVRHRAPNMDTLVALGAATAFGYSTALLLLMALAAGRGDFETVRHHAMHFYFESAAMIPTLITVGKLLEAKAKGRTTSALAALSRLAPDTALVLRDGQEVEVPVSSVAVGDVFVVRPGGQIPVDGVILTGSAAVDEAALTGESVPAEKAAGDPVSAATFNRTGYITCRATRVGEDTTLAGIIRTVTDAAATKAPLARIADRVAGVFVPVVMGLALLTFAGWLIAGQTVAFAVARAITVLVISCPCALGLATPVAIMVGSGVGAKNGILYKTASALEGVGRTRVVVFDKTGTVTAGKPTVTDILPNGIGEAEFLTLAGALEQKSEHPLGRAVTERAAGLDLPEVTDFAIIPGGGLTATLPDGDVLTGGSLAFMAQKVPLDGALRETAAALAQDGKTPLVFAKNDTVLGLIAVADAIRPEAAGVVGDLKKMGVEVVMLTGDNPRTAAAVGRQAGIGRVIAGVLPNEKAAVVERLKAAGHVTMVGDGINDAPALTVADTGLAIGAGTDIAIDAADVVLMKSDLNDVTAAVRIGRATVRNVRQNLFWAFFYNVAMIPLAAGLYGLAMKPMYGAAAMALSSFCVCVNALRLNFTRPYDGRRDRTARRKKELDEHLFEIKKEDNGMQKTLQVEGMMCMHCEARVKAALEAVPGVTSAVADHEKGTATVTLSAPVDDATLTAAVTNAGYQVKGVA